MDCIFELKMDSINMKKTGNILKSLLKRQEAINGYKAKRESFEVLKNQITKDIEEDRNIWKLTLDQLHGHKID
jgi:hypothetical protein